MNKKYQVFISSTYYDLVEERQAVSRSILDMGHIPAGMELFPAADIEQLTYVKKVIDECDYYILIVGGRYGSLGADGLSFTEQEYSYANTIKKPVLAFVHADVGSIAYSKSEHDPDKRAKLDRFIETVMHGRIVQKWSNASDLRAGAIISLQRAFAEIPQVGWVRSDTTSDEVRERIIELRERVAELEEELARAPGLLPAYNDVADLTQCIRIRYLLFGTGNLSEQVKLQDLFVGLGDTLMEGASTNEIALAIERLVSDRKGGITIRKIHSEDVRAVITTLVAAGIMEIRDEDGLTKYYLTRAGMQTWVQSGYIRATASS